MEEAKAELLAKMEKGKVRIEMETGKLKPALLEFLSNLAILKWDNIITGSLSAHGGLL